MKHRSQMFAGIVLLLGCHANCFAHGDLDSRIKSLTSRIAAQPDAVALRLERGALYRQHADYRAALADYDEVSRLAPATDDLDYAMAQVHLDAGAPERALALLDRHLAAHANEPRALLLRARTRDALAQWLPAAQDYQAAQTVIERPAPAIYIGAARALFSAGQAQDDAAFANLTVGIQRLGPLTTLIHVAVDAARERGRHDVALSFLDRLEVHVAGQPYWLAQRGDTLLALQRREAAMDTYRVALAALQALPAPRRTTTANSALEAHLAAMVAKPR